MLNAATPEPPSQGLSDPLPDVFREPARWRLSRGDVAVYQALRATEPQLVSLLDHKPAGALEALVLWESGTPLGAVSCVVQTNPLRPAEAQRFARIDIVIVPKHLRGLGLGRLLLASATAFLLQTQGPLLYSISCLAAHPAVAHALEELGFAADVRAALHYVHEELRLPPGEVPVLAERFRDEAAACLRRSAYALRQRRLASPR